MPNLKNYLTIEQCADQLGCNQSTVCRWITSGLLPKPVEYFGRRFLRKRDCKRPTGLDGRGTANFGRKRGAE